MRHLPYNGVCIKTSYPPVKDGGITFTHYTGTREISLNSKTAGYV